MTDVAIYEQPAIEQYQARLAMTPEQAKALDDQVRLCTKAVLREGTDFGVIPGGGDRQILFKPGAEKLLQWFGFGFTCDRVEIDTDEDGVRQGVTYRCTVTKQLPDGRIVGVTTCEGYAGYDELKFFKPVTDAERHKAEARERGWAKKDGRVADPTKWKNLQPYRAPWNTIIKMAQKRAIVGAAITATAAAGLFGTEEDQSPVDGDGMSAYELLMVRASRFTDPAEAGPIHVDAAHAHRDGQINRGQADYVQNTVRQRVRKLQNSVVVDVENVAPAAEDPSPAAAPPPPPEPAGEAPIPGPAAPEPAAGPGTPGDDRHKRLTGACHGHFERILGRKAKDETPEQRAERLWMAGKLAAWKDGDPESLSDLNHAELNTVERALARCKDRTALEVLLGAAGGDGNG